MAFWKHVQSNVQTLLDKKDVTLQEILAENDILQELRAHSAKLMKFILQPSILEELVDLITHDPDPQMDYKYQYKLPNMACEVLTFDISELNDALMDSPYLLTKVCNVFRQEDALNDLTASFVCKLLIVLATKRTKEFLEFIQYYDPDCCVPTKTPPPAVVDEDMPSGDDLDGPSSPPPNPTVQVDEEATQTKAPPPEHNSSFVDILLNHINNSAIKDLINRMVTCSDHPELRPKVVGWLAEAQLVPKLVAMLSSDNSEQVVTNSAKCICKIIKVGREQQIFLQEKCPPDPLLESIENTSMISDILDHAIPTGQDGASAWTLYESNFILLSLLQYKKTVPNYQDMVVDPCFMSAYPSAAEATPTMGELDNARASEAIGKCLAALTQRLPDIMKNLNFEQGSKFGSVRLEIVKLIAAMVTCTNDQALEKLKELGVVPLILDLFFAFPLCSQLHNQVDVIVQAILTPPRAAPKVEGEIFEKTQAEGDEDKKEEKDKDQAATEGESKKEEPAEKHVLFDQLIGECSLIEKILDNYRTVPKEQKGYNGHLRIMANYIEAMESNAFAAQYKEVVEKMPEELRERWQTFRESLANINKHYAKTIDSITAAASSSDEEGDPEDLRDMGISNTDMIAAGQQNFNEYQLNPLTASSIDKFGFDDSEFTEVDVPGITNVTSPPVDDHSSDEEEADASGESCDPWCKMDEGFNPWEMASTSESKDSDGWANFGSLKTELAGGTSSKLPTGDDKEVDWAEFESFKPKTTSDPSDASQTKATGSDDEF